jgi:hypothetical protein
VTAAPIVFVGARNDVEHLAATTAVIGEVAVQLVAWKGIGWNFNPSAFGDTDRTPRLSRTGRSDVVRPVASADLP